MAIATPRAHPTLGLGVTHVAMEATGVYRKPVYYLLEDDFELLLVNAQHVKNVPGRKSERACCVRWPGLRHSSMNPSVSPQGEAGGSEAAAKAPRQVKHDRRWVTRRRS